MIPHTGGTQIRRQTYNTWELGWVLLPKRITLKFFQIPSNEFLTCPSVFVFFYSTSRERRQVNCDCLQTSQLKSVVHHPRLVSFQAQSSFGSSCDSTWARASRMCGNILTGNRPIKSTNQRRVSLKTQMSNKSTLWIKGMSHQVRYPENPTVDKDPVFLQNYRENKDKRKNSWVLPLRY